MEEQEWAEGGEAAMGFKISWCLSTVSLDMSLLYPQSLRLVHSDADSENFLETPTWCLAQSEASGSDSDENDDENARNMHALTQEQLRGAPAAAPWRGAAGLECKSNSTGP